MSAQGHTDNIEMLPHMVLNDSQLPLGSEGSGQDGHVGAEPGAVVVLTILVVRLKYAAR